MAIDIASAGKSAANTAVSLTKAYIVPIFIGVLVIGIIVGLIPAAKKFLVA